MKAGILIDGPGAHQMERLGLARALASSHEVVVWDIRAKSPYDFFDEFVPDILIGQVYNVSESLINVLKENPKTRLYLKVGDTAKYDLSKYEILVADDKQFETVRRLSEILDNQIVVGAHYKTGTEEETHGGWTKLGVKLLHSMLGYDVFLYADAVEQEVYSCDIGLVSGRWNYKGKTFSEWLDPLFNPKYNYNIKIFGNGWGTQFHCGRMEEENEKHFLKSCKVAVNLHEPHMHDAKTGNPHEINERAYKLGGIGCFSVSDWSPDLEELFSDCVVFAKNHKEFKEQIDHFLRYPHERLPYIERYQETVLNNHTYHHRAATLLRGFDLYEEANRVMESYENLRKS